MSCFKRFVISDRLFSKQMVQLTCLIRNNVSTVIYPEPKESDSWNMSLMSSLDYRPKYTETISKFIISKPTKVSDGSMVFDRRGTAIFKMKGAASSPVQWSESGMVRVAFCNIFCNGKMQL